MRGLRAAYILEPVVEIPNLEENGELCINLFR